MREVEVFPHNPDWKKEFRIEAQKIASALGDDVIEIHHIGSTAIKTIFAKPIIDFLVEIKNINGVDIRNKGMEILGYEAMGEFGIRDRRYFRKDNKQGIRTHHVHVFPTDSAQVKRHLKFRDYLIAHPDEAERYSQLKQELAKKYPTNIEAYMDEKDQFIREIDRKAAQWR